MTWVTFGGSPGESSGDFIQAIQRVSFQQGHVRDDHWIADYVSTCFNGDALHWYSELDSETQESWRKLRTALLRRFPAITPSPVSPTQPLNTPAPRNRGSHSPRSAIAKSGLIEVVAESTTSLGYLGLDPTTHVGIITGKAQAIVVNLPAQPSSEPFQLSLVREPIYSHDTRCFNNNLPTQPTLPNNAVSSLSNLGLALFSDGRAEPDKIPAPIKIYMQDEYDYEDGPWQREAGIPRPSALCKGHGWVPPEAVPIATWILSLCGDSGFITLVIRFLVRRNILFILGRPASVYRRRSATRTPSQRASAAIWKHDKNSGELRIRWLMDDDSTHSLYLICFVLE